MNASSSTSASLQRWQQWWAFKMPYVVCLRCEARQHLEDAHLPFNSYHAPDCALRSDLPQYPGRDFLKIMDQRKQEHEHAPRHP